MVGQRVPTVNKPSRSDEVLDPAQQLQIADQIRAQLESMTPKRPTKPSRSEPDPDDSPAHQACFAGPIPEFERLQSLKSQSQVIFPKEGDGTMAQEEFVETQYYKELVSIDKQHHTTGTGFIKVTRERVENGNELCDEREINNNGPFSYSGIKSNPATNDWIPCNDYDQAVNVSSKPSRSG